MDCESIGPDLSALADGELPLDAAAPLEAHVAACPRRARLESWRAAGWKLRAEDATRDPAAAIAAVLEGRRGGRRRLSFRIALRTGVAAAVVAAVALFYGPVEAQREAAEIVRLDVDLRAAASEELASLEATQMELTALFMSLRSLELDDPAAREISLAARGIAAKAAAIQERLRSIREDLDRDGLFPPRGFPYRRIDRFPNADGGVR